VTEWLQFFHVLAATVWLGSTIYLESLMAGAKRTGDRTVLMQVYLRVAETNKRIIGPAAIVAIAFGFWLVIDFRTYEFEQLWVALALVIAIFSVSLSVFYLAPQGDEIAKRAAEDGLDDDGAHRKLRSVANVAHVNTLMLVVILYLMIFKPGL
jgi:uncharacterized membrane protein